MTARTGRAWALLVAAVLVQTALGVVWPSLVWMPDLIGAVGIATALEHDRATSLLVGLAAGAWQDLSLGRLIGLHASLWAVTGYAVSSLRMRMPSDSWLVTIWIALAVLVAERLGEWVVLTLVGVAVAPLIVLLAATVVTVPFVLLFRRLMRVGRSGLRRAVP
ncbi:MAG: rod shape-determining protein MreD [Sulfobacillus sp.]